MRVALRWVVDGTCERKSDVMRMEEKSGVEEVGSGTSRTPTASELEASEEMVDVDGGTMVSVERWFMD